jgi:translation initiation factor IF-3
MKLRPKIGEHDFQTKFHAVKSFLEEGDKVKLTIMFRGREMVHQDIGKRLLERMALELKPISTVERMPLLEGRNMIMILAPAGAAAPPAPPTTPAAPAAPPTTPAVAPAQPSARAQAPKS